MTPTIVNLLSVLFSIVINPQNIGLTGFCAIPVISCMVTLYTPHAPFHFRSFHQLTLYDLPDPWPIHSNRSHPIFLTDPKPASILAFIFLYIFCMFALGLMDVKLPIRSSFAGILPFYVYIPLCPCF